ncbi:hypothetical protein CDL12_28206 [Handroanthus impetiginosus]|uniref:Receptor ligand binding region domain-containing protein n=1 Tax=Handroanthus impetiginosus TaxID=429701 RepID=A0A2G9G1W3_9LAMI|nr:hypothetical protein CDL12_28206 [Handroanthus impetiginosus]
MQSFVNIGVVQDLNSSFDAMINLCIQMAISNFYLGHPNYTPRLRLCTKHAQNALDVDLAVLELLEHEHVHGILGHPQQSTEDKFIAEIGSKVHIPIISFTARTSTISTTQNHYYVRTTIDDAVQTRALASICRRFEWTEVVFLYEDTEYSLQFLSHLNKALQEADIGLTHMTAIPTSAKDKHIFKELSILNTKRTRVFFLGAHEPFALFTKKRMMSEGYAWIITDSSSNFLNSMDLTTRHSMEGVVGIRPYVPLSKDLENFQERWRMNLKKNKGTIMDLNVYGLWAYDTIKALATAIKKIGPVNSSSLYVKGTKGTNLIISSYGPQLLRELSSTKFRGLSGDFQLVDGKLKPSAFEIFNLIGTGEKRVGFWSPERGIVRELSSSSINELKKIVWPGDSVEKPKGRSIPATRTLKVGVPWKSGYKEFVNVSIDAKTNRTGATGFAIDIFLAALKVLPFHIDYEFHCYKCTQNVNWTYDDMLHGIPHQVFDLPLL